MKYREEDKTEERGRDKWREKENGSREIVSLILLHPEVKTSKKYHERY